MHIRRVIKLYICVIYYCFHFKGITVQFSSNKYEVKENDSPAQLVLLLSKPLEYCSSSILIKVEDVTATGT